MGVKTDSFCISGNKSWEYDLWKKMGLEISHGNKKVKYGSILCLFFISIKSIKNNF